MPAPDHLLTNTRRASQLLAQTSSLPLLILACLTACKTTGAAPDDPTQPAPMNIARLSPEECKLRAEAMARQEQDMRSAPQEIVDTSQPDRRPLQWENANNPCPESASSTTAPEADPVLLTTQIDVALEEDSPEKARRILPSLFSQRTRGDQSLKALTDRVMLAYMPSRHIQHQATRDFTRTEDGQLLCAATTSPQPDVTDMQAMTEVVTGDTVHLSCALPPRSREITSSVLLLRMRQDTGSYTRIAALDTGDLATLPADQKVLQASIMLDEGFLEQTEQAYIEAILLDAKQTTDLATALSRGGFFWFDAP